MITSQTPILEADLLGKKSYKQLLQHAETLGHSLGVTPELFTETMLLLEDLRGFDEQTAKESIQSLGLALAIVGVYQQFYNHPINLHYVWASALLHDIGKMGVGHDLIDKSNAGYEWTDADREKMCAHPLAGFTIACDHNLPYTVCRVIAEHHHLQLGRTYGMDEHLNDEERIVRDSVAVADFTDAALNRTNTRNVHLSRDQRLAEVREDIYLVFRDYHRGRELAQCIYERLTQPIYSLV